MLTKTLIQRDIPANYGSGLREKPLGSDFRNALLAQVYRLERQFQWWRSGRCYRSSSEVEFGITSLSRANAPQARLLKIRRAHWGIETELHGRRNMIFKENATRMTVGDTGKVMDSINNLMIAFTRQAKFKNTAQARRWFAAHISEAFLLLTSPFSRLW